MPEHEIDHLVERLQQHVDRRTLGLLAAGALGAVSTLRSHENLDAKKKKNRKKNENTPTPAPPAQDPDTPQPPGKPAFVFDKTLGELADNSPGLLPYPVDVATDGEGSIYVLDTDKAKIVKFTSDGQYLTEFGGHGSGNGKFANPYILAVDAAGWMYVADSEGDNPPVYRLTVLSR